MIGIFKNLRCQMPLPSMLWLPLVLLIAMTAGTAEASRFAVAGPIWKVDDTTAIEEPGTNSLNQVHDFIDGYWLRPFDETLSLRRDHGALDLNAIDEVPASTWFTPRIGRKPLPRGSVGLGNTEKDAALGEGALRVVAARIEGSEPYLEIREANGRTCLIEFDDPANPEARTAAAVIASRLLYAAGYEVFESFIAFVDPGRFTIDETAEKINPYGGRGDLKQKDLDGLFQRLDNGENQLRVAVSRAPNGQLKGGFCDKGTRLDDPNDKISHEDRRSLRGLRILCSWLDLTAMRSDRTMDVYLQPGGYLQHHLVMLGASLGVDRLLDSPPSGAEFAAPYPAAGAQSQNGWGRGLGQGRSAGGATRFSGVGDFSSLDFDPLAWKPAYGFEPFRRMEWADALWGAALVSVFTDEQIVEAVYAGELTEKESRNYLAGTLMERRDAIEAALFTTVNPSCLFKIGTDRGGKTTLLFEDLSLIMGISQSEDMMYTMNFSLPELGQTLGSQSRGGYQLAFDLSSFVPSNWLHRKDDRRYGCAAIRCYDYLGRVLTGETRVHIYFGPEETQVIGIERF
jgi:hypothetical protein